MNINKISGSMTFCGHLDDTGKNEFKSYSSAVLQMPGFPKTMNYDLQFIHSPNPSDDIFDINIYINCTPDNNNDPTYAFTGIRVSKDHCTFSVATSQDNNIICQISSNEINSWFKAQLSYNG